MDLGCGRLCVATSAEGVEGGEWFVRMWPDKRPANGGQVNETESGSWGRRNEVRAKVHGVFYDEMG